MSQPLKPLLRRLGLSKITRHNRLNVSDGERLACAFAGAAIMVAGLSKNGVIAKLSMLITGGIMLKRAATGHCELYDLLNLNSHSALALAKNLVR